MKIAEASKCTGLSRDTIRWYEKIGLIALNKSKRDANNYRKFDQETVDRLMLIKGAKTFGFTLKEIEQFLLLDDENRLICDSVSEIFESKVKAIEWQIKELQQLKAKLLDAQGVCTGRCKEVLM